MIQIIYSFIKPYRVEALFNVCEQEINLNISRSSFMYSSMQNKGVVSDPSSSLIANLELAHMIIDSWLILQVYQFVQNVSYNWQFEYTS